MSFVKKSFGNIDSNKSKDRFERFMLQKIPAFDDSDFIPN